MASAADKPKTPVPNAEGKMDSKRSDSKRQKSLEEPTILNEQLESDPLGNYSYSEESKKALSSLKKAYEEKNFVLADKIIEEMVNKSMVNGLKKIHTAAGYGFAELVEQYVKETDPNSECSFNELNSITPLHFCSGIGPDPISPDRVKCIEILVNNGAKINSVTSRNDTSLHWATKLADFQVCQKLIQCGADVNILNTDNCTCAHGAAFYKNIEVLEMLLESKIDVNVQDVSGKNILHLLCKDPLETNQMSKSDSDLDKTFINESKDKQKKFISLVDKLLNTFKMDPNCNDLAEFNPLMYSCEHESIELLEILINYKGDINFSNSEGVNCMLLAIVNSLPNVVKFLLDKKFDIKKAAANISYITDAAYLNEIEILKMLIDAGCDVNETKQDENGVILNPLWAACERSNVSVVDILLKHGAHTLIRPDLNMTALHCTAMSQYESLPIAKLLVEHKCPLNLKSSQAGETPLFLASNSGFAEIVEFLLELGVDPNESSPINRSCFQQAVFRGHKDVVLLLINKGYKLNEEDKQDLILFIMDLYQDNDCEMINFLLTKNLTDKQQILDCIKKVKEWQIQEHSDQLALKNETSTDNLKLNLVQTHPCTIEELETFLNNKCNVNSYNSGDEF